jgi:hypothetical protein
MPVSALNPRKVVAVPPENRSKTGRSRKANESTPSVTAAAMSVRAIPAPSRLTIMRTRRTAPPSVASRWVEPRSPSSRSRPTYSGSTPAFSATSRFQDSATGCSSKDTETDRQRFRWSRADLWASQDVNLGPHPYQQSRVERHADRRVPRLSPSISAELIRCWRSALDRGRCQQERVRPWRASPWARRSCLPSGARSAQGRSGRSSTPAWGRSMSPRAAGQGPAAPCARPSGSGRARRGIPCVSARRSALASRPSRSPCAASP